MSFETFLKELSEAYQTPLFPDSFGVCLLSFKEQNLQLLFEYDEHLVPNTVLLSCYLLPLPLQNRREILEFCLKNNHFIGETLSCKPDDEVVYLHRRFHPQSQAEELKTLLSEFVESAKAMREQIQELSLKSFSPFSIPPP